MASVSSDGKRGGGVLLGLLLVTLGVLLLLTTIDVVSLGIWFELAKFWPVLLVLIGVEIIFARRTPLLRAALIAATLVAVIAAAHYSVPEYDPKQPLHAAYVEPLSDTETLHLNADFMAGGFQLSAESSGAKPGTGLLAVDFNNQPARVTTKRSNGDLRIRLASSGPYLTYSSDTTHTTEDGKTITSSSTSSTTNVPIGLADWRLTVPPDVEIEIDISSGVADLDLDLRNLNVRKLTIQAGVTDIRIQLPTNARETHIDINAAAADIDLVVPPRIDARIKIDAPLKSTQIDTTRFIETTNGYQSTTYNQATNHININIEAFMTDINIS